MRKHRLLSIVLVLCMVMSLIPVYALAENFGDTNGHWAETQIDRWSGYGVVEGVGNGEFQPDNNMTRAQAAQVFVNLLKLEKTAELTAFNDVQSGSWYYDALSKVVAAGIMNGTSGNTLSPNGTLSREMMFVMLARALGVEEDTNSSKNFADSGEIDGWARGYINALINKGYIDGVGDNRIAPRHDINRASVMKVLDNLIGGYGNEDGQTVEIVKGKITLVVADNVKLTGEANEKDYPIIIAGKAKNVDMAGVKGTAFVQVTVSDVAIENAPVGTEIKAAEGVENVTANGIDVSGDSDKDVVIPDDTEQKPSTPLPPVSQLPKYSVTYKYSPTSEENSAMPYETIKDENKYEKGKQVSFTINAKGNNDWFVGSIEIHKLNNETIGEEVDTQFTKLNGGLDKDGNAKYTFNMPESNVIVVINVNQTPEKNCNRPQNNCEFPEYTDGAEYDPSSGENTAPYHAYLLDVTKVGEVQEGKKIEGVTSKIADKNTITGNNGQVIKLTSEGFDYSNGTFILSTTLEEGKFSDQVQEIMLFDSLGNKINAGPDGANLKGDITNNGNSVTAKYSFVWNINSDVYVYLRTMQVPADNCQAEGNCVFPEKNCMSSDVGTQGGENGTTYTAA